jgi:hypothetical protein
MLLRRLWVTFSLGGARPLLTKTRPTGLQYAAIDVARLHAHGYACEQQARASLDAMRRNFACLCGLMPRFNHLAEAWKACLGLCVFHGSFVIWGRRC